MVEKLKDCLAVLHIDEEMSTVEISEKLKFFTLRNYQGEINNDKLDFLKNLYLYSHKKTRKQGMYSANYFFKAGTSYIELDVSVLDDIEISVYLHYNNEMVKNDLHELIELDQFLCSVLKHYGLQN